MNQQEYQNVEGFDSIISLAGKRPIPDFIGGTTGRPDFPLEDIGQVLADRCSISSHHPLLIRVEIGGHLKPLPQKDVVVGPVVGSDQIRVGPHATSRSWLPARLSLPALQSS